MRALALCLLLVTACGKKPAEGDTSGSGSATSVLDEEQARFDVERRPETVVKALGIKPGSRVADIGAGSGLLTVHLARAVSPNGRVIATDTDASVLDLLSQRLKSQKLDGVVEPRVVAADTPGLEAGQYDAILLAEVDNYFTDPVTWIKSAAAALKPGGRLVISNRIYHKAQSTAAAQKAGLVELEVTTPMPSHFIAVYGPPGTKVPK